jgi:hypothetical protein
VITLSSRFVASSIADPDPRCSSLKKARLNICKTIAHPSAMATQSGDRCIVARTSLILGGSAFPATEVFSCGNMTRKATDTDCLLPTYFFKQIFISHTNSYIIVNPKKTLANCRNLPTPFRWLDDW